MNSITSDLIAPCGMNCRLCRACGREKNPCPGCHEADGNQSKSIARCRIRNCEPVKTGLVTYCFECGKFPCAALRQLDDRYRTRYHMSMIDNLERIGCSGMEEFIRLEKERWACSKCGVVVCIHKEACAACGRKWR